MSGDQKRLGAFGQATTTATGVKNFNQQRKESANVADAATVKCYIDHFGVSESDIYDVDALTSGRYDATHGYDIHQILDYGGCDKIIDCGSRHVHVEQKVRPVTSGEDLAVRTDNGSGEHTAKLPKWLNAHEHRGYYPSMIGWGRYDHTIDVLAEFHLVDVATLLSALDRGRIHAPEHENTQDGDDTAARYISAAELDRVDAVVAQWEKVCARGGVAA